jgi:hypothetical protein
MSGTIQGNNWANVFHAQLSTSSAISQADFDTYIAAFAAAYKTRFQAQMGSTVQVTQCKAVLYTPGGGELISSPVITPWNGTGAGALAASLCTVVSWLTGVYWRGGKPRTYLPGLPTGDLNANLMTILTVWRTATITAANSFRTDINALTSGTITGSVLGFISFFTNNALRTPPIFYPFTGATVHPRAGSQRRRDGRWMN